MADRIKFFFIFIMVLAGSGCTVNNEHPDLRQFVSKTKSMPKKSILPLPPIKAYEAFTYDASGLRSPFAAPSQGLLQKHISRGLKPDPDRKKHFLERFAFDAFLMVGTLGKNEETKGLIKVDKRVYLVSEGDYIGRNHGKIIEITEKAIHVTELVPSGLNLWIERPRRLTLK